MAIQLRHRPDQRFPQSELGWERGRGLDRYSGAKKNAYLSHRLLSHLVAIRAYANTPPGWAIFLCVPGFGLVDKGSGTTAQVSRPNLNSPGQPFFREQVGVGHGAYGEMPILVMVVVEGNPDLLQVVAALNQGSGVPDSVDEDGDQPTHKEDDKGDDRKVDTATHVWTSKLRALSLLMVKGLSNRHPAYRPRSE